MEQLHLPRKRHNDRGYDDGYTACPCFWGRDPSSNSRTCQLHAICGYASPRYRLWEGKNAAFMASHGAIVDAVDISKAAIRNGRAIWEPSPLLNGTKFPPKSGLPSRGNTTDHRRLWPSPLPLHLGRNICHVESPSRDYTRDGGYHVLCAFNSRSQDLSAHPGFRPTLVQHDDDVEVYSKDSVLHSSDADLTEVHPHNLIEHTHSLTRLMVQIRHHDVTVPTPT